MRSSACKACLQEDAKHSWEEALQAGNDVAGCKLRPPCAWLVFLGSRGLLRCRTTAGGSSEQDGKVLLAGGVLAAGELGAVLGAGQRCGGHCHPAASLASLKAALPCLAGSLTA